jgi:hypothetical protein
MDTFNIISFGKKENNLRTSVAYGVIGSALTTFKNNVVKDAQIFLHCKAMIWGCAKVSSDYFYSETELWEDKTYPHRFKISDIKLLDNPIPLSDGTINKAFKEQYGTGWAYKFIFTPKPVPKEIASLILGAVKKIETQINQVSHF